MDSQFSNFEGKIARLISPEKLSARSFLTSLNKGDTVKGKVMEILSPEKYTVRIRGKDIVAETNLELKPGNIYTFQVKTTFPNISVSLVRPDTAADTT